MKKQSLINIFLAIFADILSFGMIIPLSPILARDFGADGLQVGMLISIYSIMQFLVAPYWGRLSDKIGRKPVLLVGFLGVAFAHLWFAYSDTLLQLFLSRALAGFFGANIVIGMAYIADITKPEERSKNLGLIGVAFGLGFTFGPALGFLFIMLGKQFGSLPPFGESFAACGAALVCLFNFVLSFLYIKESHFIQKKIQTPASSFLTRIKKINWFKIFKLAIASPTLLSQFHKSNLFQRPSLHFIWKALREPQLGKVLFMSFILWIGIAKIEPVLLLLVQDDFGWQKSTAYWSFAYIGLLMAFSQGYLVRKWIPAFGEKKVNQYGLFLFFIGLFLIGLSPLKPINSLFLQMSLLASGVTLFILGYSLSSTSLSGAISLLSPKQHQGSIFGINQSLTSLARITGPIIGGLCYRDLSHESPFFLAALMGVVAFSLAWWIGDQFPQLGHSLKNLNPSYRNSSNRSSSNESLSATSNEPKDFFVIDAYQLQNLIEKRVYCLFFFLEERAKWEEKTGYKQEDKNNKEQYELRLKEYRNQEEGFMTGLDKLVQFKTEQEIVDSLKDKEKNQPIVLLCLKGSLSKKASENLRQQGYINAYYLESGLSSL